MAGGGRGLWFWFPAADIQKVLSLYSQNRSQQRADTPGQFQAEWSGQQGHEVAGETVGSGASGGISRTGVYGPR